MLLFGRPSRFHRLTGNSNLVRFWVISGSAKKLPIGPLVGNKRKHTLLPELWARASASAGLLGSQIAL